MRISVYVCTCYWVCVIIEMIHCDVRILGQREEFDLLKVVCYFVANLAVNLIEHTYPVS